MRVKYCKNMCHKRSTR